MTEQNGDDGRLHRTPNQWHQDRRFAVGLIITMAAYFGGIVWWGATLQEHNDASDKTLLSLSESLVEVGKTSVITARILSEFDGKMNRAEQDIVKLQSRTLAALNAEPRITALETEHAYLFSQIQRQLGELNLALATALRGLESNKREQSKGAQP